MILKFFAISLVVSAKYCYLQRYYQEIPFKKDANSEVIRVPFATICQMISPLSTKVHLRRFI